MAINYLKLARKITSAKAPPAWMRNREEWQALQSIVGGWLATTAVIASDTPSGFALVDMATGERSAVEPRPQPRTITNVGEHPIDVLGTMVQPGERATIDHGPPADLKARASEIAEKLTKAQWLGIMMLARGDRLTVSPRIENALRAVGLIDGIPDGSNQITLTPLGVEVARGRRT